MAARGRKPTPTKLLKLKGSYRADRHGQRSDLQAVSGPAPRCPSWLDEEAKREWKRLAPRLIELGLLTALDVAAFASYCTAWSEFQAATAMLAKEGRTTTNAKTGAVHSHPAVNQQRTALQALRQFAALFGLDPSDRTRVDVIKPEVPDALEAYLGKQSISGFARKRGT